ncbi:MAG TPA: hypothetical protein PKD76_05485 [Solirubrobacterales bacterium]|nr:hypothetical protein [Solirubrobacterales bacterium]
MNSGGKQSETGIRANLSGAIYGTIVSMTVVATASKDVGLSPVEIAAWAASTGFVFWLVHVYADVVGAGYTTLRDARKHGLHALRDEWPIVKGAMIPALAMLAAPLGLVDKESASFFAVCAGILALFATGLLIGAREGQNWGRRIMIGSVNAFFGLVILALKIFVH